MKPNPGHLPAEAKGKRVRGRLANGSEFGFVPVATATPAGWAADGCRWTLTEFPFDIASYEVIGA